MARPHGGGLPHEVVRADAGVLRALEVAIEEPDAGADGQRELGGARREDHAAVGVEGVRDVEEDGARLHGEDDAQALLLDVFLVGIQRSLLRVTLY